MMIALKGKLISWSHNMLSLAGRILVANQVLLTSIWYLAACWNPNPRMCCQVRRVIRNFIWGGKDAPTRAKVKWDTLVLLIAQGGLGVTDPKSQSKALLAKLLVRGLAPGNKPWKELIRHKADQTRLPVHGKGPTNPDLNWLLSTPKFKRLQCSMWKSIVGAWLKVRPGLTKSDPMTADEILRQPLFGNPSILSASGTPLGVSGLNEGCTFAHSGCSRVKDLWSLENKDWRGLSKLGMSHHASNRRCKDIITASIPWRPDEHDNHIQVRDWIGNPIPGTCNLLDWVYHVLAHTCGKAEVLEFQKLMLNGRIQATSQQVHTIFTVNYRTVRVLHQKKPGATLEVARDLSTPGKKPLLYWIFETGFIQDLPWDPGKWHWRSNLPLGDAPFFRYTAKRGYINTRKTTRSSNMVAFIQGFNFRNTSSAQMIAKL